MFINYQNIGENRQVPRLWVESGRLAQIGFPAGSRFNISPTLSGGLQLTANPHGERMVSSRKHANALRPIIDVENAALLGKLAEYGEVKVTGNHNSLLVEPSRRAFAIHTHRQAVQDGKIPVLEFFTGGGTVSEAFHGDPRFDVLGAVEIDARFSDVYVKKFPKTRLYLMDSRKFDPADAPLAAILFASLPCTCFSLAGVSKKGLKGRYELGDTGDLFIPFLACVRHMMPLGLVVENVPNFGNSYAAAILREALRRYGYHLTETILEPSSQWGEIQDRRRYVMVATLGHPFSLQVPNTPFAGTAGDFLDPEDPQLDKDDAARIAGTIATLDRHFAKHKALGHGFSYTTINRNSTVIPTITRSYHKINNGPFVETPYGLRLLRLHEMEKIFGATAGTDHYATGVEILGQGTLTRIFKSIVGQIADHLTNPSLLRKDSCHLNKTDCLQFDLFQ